MRKWSGIALGALLVGIFAAVATVPLIRLGPTRQIEARRAAIRAAGAPADLAEVEAWYPRFANPAENAAPYVERAGELLRRNGRNRKLSLPLDEVPLPPPGEPFTPEQKDEIAAVLEANADSIALFREAARLKKARYDVDLTAGIDARLPHLAWVGSGAGLLMLDAAIRTERGDTDAAVEDIAAIVALGDTLAEEPTVVSQLVRVRVHVAKALPALARLLSRARPSEAQLVRLSEMLRATERRDTLHRAVAVDRCGSDALFDDPERIVELWPLLLPLNGEPPPLPTWFVQGPYRRLGLIEWDHLYFIERMEAYEAAARAPIDERAGRIEAVERAAAEAPWCSAVSQILLDDEGGRLMSSVRHAAQLRCARVALAVERHRLGHGALPERLIELVPEYLEAVPLDPFAREPLKYRREDGAYAVYSVGSDGKDDGGRPRRSASSRSYSGHGPDEMFEVQRPAEAQ